MAPRTPVPADGTAADGAAAATDGAAAATDGLPPSRLVLPDVPPALRDAAVAVWHEPVTIDTYDPMPPTPLPMHLARRVYQGSSGRVYPLPLHDRISPVKRPRTWQAVHLQNTWLRLMVLPELGGRIHVGVDRTTGYDFFYRNQVVKPALVGLAGPWASGGVEFNWPQHHRPGTFMPVHTAVETHPDGAVTLWCSDHDPVQRMKGMHGITLHPDRAVVEVRVRLHNRTDDVRTFLWWANAAVHVHDRHQSFFPGDVTVVADHARRATTGFPRATGRYYGVDYPGRVTPGRPDADRLDRYRNIPVPTSYMCTSSHQDFFGGYDHAADAGLVHWADHRVAPGKKQWTWGDAPFGHAWDRNLTDGDGPYVELMAGVFTDNQPDFSFLAPGETKTFTQVWYPVQRIGVVQQATAEVALHVVDADDPDAPPPTAATAAPHRRVHRLDVGVAVTRLRPGLTVQLLDATGAPLWQRTDDLGPARPLRCTVRLEPAPARGGLVLRVLHGGRVLLEHAPFDPPRPAAPVHPATAPPEPADVPGVDELYLTGVHLAQYRHATRAPEPYWLEALRRDPHEARCCTALAARAHARAEYDRAEQLLRRAVGRLTALNANPPDGEAHYRLGLVLARTHRADEAHDAFAKAAWHRAWRAPAHLAWARMLAAAGHDAGALALLDEALALDTDLLAARDLRVVVLRRLGRHAEAEAQLAATLALDPLDLWALDLAGRELPCDARTLLDVAAEHGSCGADDDALRLLALAVRRGTVEPWGGTVPLAHLHRAVVLERLGDPAAAALARRAAADADQTYCFPHGLDDEAALRAALAADPHQGRVAALLGHWLEAAGRTAEAEPLWRLAVAEHPDDAVSWRCLGVAAHDLHADATAARACYDRAVAAAPADARLRHERDQLARRTGAPVAARLADLLDARDLVAARDDLTVELAGLLVAADRPSEALDVLQGRVFQPWEGGEGQVLAVWERVHTRLGRRALAAGDAPTALAHARAALAPPGTLGEAPHPLAARAVPQLLLGDAAAAAGRADEARAAWTLAAATTGDFEGMTTVAYGVRTHAAARALRRLGDPAAALALLDALEAHARRLLATPAEVDHFATSLPDLLLFADDLTARQHTTARLLLAQAALVRGRTVEARDGVLEVLARDPHQPDAQDLLHEIDHLTPGSPV